MATYTSIFSARFRKAIRSLNIGVASTAAQADADVPLITSGTAAPTAAVPGGSLYLRSTVGLYARIASAWVQLADFASTAGAAFTNQVTTTDGVASGTARRVGGVASRSVAASAAQLGTVETETNFSESYSIPANTLKVGTVVRVRAQGIHTATTGAETHDILVKLGATTIMSKTGIDPANSDGFWIDAVIQIRTAGAGGTMVACGAMGFGASGAAAAQSENYLLASTAVDTTAALVIAIAIDRQAAAADTDSARLDILVVEVIG